MKIIDLIQDSCAWHDWRMGKIGGSSCPVIMEGSDSQKKSLAREIVKGVKKFQTVAMKEGKDLEGLGREYAESCLAVRLNPLCIEDESIPWRTASLDGFNQRSSLMIEIKWTNETAIKQIRNGKIPSKYLWQVYHNMSICNPISSYLVIGNRDNHSEIILVEVLRDEEKIRCLKEKEEDFYNSHILFFREETENLPENNEPGLQSYLQRYSDLGKSIESLEALKEEREECKEKILDLIGRSPCISWGYKISKIEEKGRVDYKQLPGIESINLDQFRGPTVIKWRITG